MAAKLHGYIELLPEADGNVCVKHLSGLWDVDTLPWRCEDAEERRGRDGVVWDDCEFLRVVLP